jgi:hypothetical protein
VDLFFWGIVGLELSAKFLKILWHRLSFVCSMGATGLSLTFAGLLTGRL